MIIDIHFTSMPLLLGRYDSSGGKSWSHVCYQVDTFTANISLSARLQAFATAPRPPCNRLSH